MNSRECMARLVSLLPSSVSVSNVRHSRGGSAATLRADIMGRMSVVAMAVAFEGEASLVVRRSVLEYPSGLAAWSALVESVTSVTSARYVPCTEVTIEFGEEFL